MKRQTEVLKGARALKRLARLLLTAFLLALLALPAWSADFGKRDKSTVRKALKGMTGPVTIHYYRGGQSRSDATAAELLKYMERTSKKLSVVTHELGEEGTPADFDVDHGPVMVFEGPSVKNIRFYGYPARLELEPFLDGVLIASGSPPEVSDATRSYLASLKERVHLRVFTTPD